jgi:hypothetical protein
MKESKDIENYIEQLLNTTEIDKSVFAEIPNIQLLLAVYILGLQKKDLEPEILFHHFTLDDLPAEFHTMLAQLSIIKAKSTIEKIVARPEILQYLIQNTSKLLQEFKDYFIIKS